MLQGAGAQAVTYMDAQDNPIYEPPLGTTKLWANTVVIGLFEADVDPFRIVHFIEISRRYRKGCDRQDRWRLDRRLCDARSQGHADQYRHDHQPSQRPPSLPRHLHLREVLQKAHGLVAEGVQETERTIINKIRNSDKGLDCGFFLRVVVGRPPRPVAKQVQLTGKLFFLLKNYFYSILK